MEFDWRWIGLPSGRCLDQFRFGNGFHPLRVIDGWWVDSKRAVILEPVQRWRQGRAPPPLPACICRASLMPDGPGGFLPLSEMLRYAPRCSEMLRDAPRCSTVEVGVKLMMASANSISVPMHPSMGMKRRLRWRVDWWTLLQSWTMIRKVQSCSVSFLFRFLFACCCCLVSNRSLISISFFLHFFMAAKEEKMLPPSKDKCFFWPLGHSSHRITPRGCLHRLPRLPRLRRP